MSFGTKTCTSPQKAFHLCAVIRSLFLDVLPCYFVHVTDMMTAAIPLRLFMLLNTFCSQNNEKEIVQFSVLPPPFTAAIPFYASCNKIVYALTYACTRSIVIARTHTSLKSRSNALVQRGILMKLPTISNFSQSQCC